MSRPAGPRGFYVYALLRENGTPFYIGKGSGQRWLSHEMDARRGMRGYKYAIIRRMQARGAEVVKIKIHEGLTEAVAHEYEVALIRAIGRGRFGPLANLTDGGEGVSGLQFTAEHRQKLAVASRGRKHTPEAKAKVSAANVGKVRGPRPLETRLKIAAANLGKVLSPETRLKLSAARKAGPRRTLSPQHVANIAAALRGRPGKPMTPEQRAKVSAAKRGKKQSPEAIAARVARNRLRAPQGDLFQ